MSVIALAEEVVCVISAGCYQGREPRGGVSQPQGSQEALERMALPVTI